MPTGKIVKWNRGWGFIRPDSGDCDVFAHCHALVDQSRDFLPIGTRVQFEIQPDARNGKPRAAKIAELDAPPRCQSARAAAENLFRAG